MKESLAANDCFSAAEAKNPAISAAEWLRARGHRPLRFCDAIFVPLKPKHEDFSDLMVFELEM